MISFIIDEIFFLKYSFIKAYARFHVRVCENLAKAKVGGTTQNNSDPGNVIIAMFWGV